ncbi:MAG: chromosome segregation protein SMC, partial [Pseudomonadota bacterium]
ATRAGEEERAARGRARRLSELEGEEKGWHRRSGEAGGRIEALARRAAETETALAAARAAPEAVAADQARLADGQSRAAERRTAARAALSAAEDAAAGAAREARAAEKAASEAREARGRLDERVEAATGAAAEAEAALAALPAPEAADADAEPEDRATEAAGRGDLKALEAEIQRLTRARDALGAVNLRAEEDAAALRTEREALEAEKADLEGAIAKLRAGVGALNREGRQRLTTAFEAVNTAFAQLFRRLFEGGEARLVMVEDDDPLEAGLEILCQPPGKKLSSLSLLSGGEQTLTALALILAVFLCQPAPICVLDEVDAPLDDANTERFCALLDEMRAETDTRFLVITHHPLTMARMDRLFGVTMVEQGVSQLVSVDLVAAEALVEA